jgi:hypothetical protein
MDEPGREHSRQVLLSKLLFDARDHAHLRAALCRGRRRHGAQVHGSAGGCVRALSPHHVVRSDGERGAVCQAVAAESGMIHSW